MQSKAKDATILRDLSLAITMLMGPGEYVLERPGDPEQGHFGLAVHDYTHSTAPNRRFADLVSQRILKAVLQRTTRTIYRRRAFHASRRIARSRKLRGAKKWNAARCRSGIGRHGRREAGSEKFSMRWLPERRRRGHCSRISIPRWKRLLRRKEHQVSVDVEMSSA